MTASLIVAGYELLGSTTNPEYRLAPDFDFGTGEPDQTTIASLYLDGEVVTGSRTSNRHMRLPLWVFGSNASELAGLVSTLLQAVNSDTFTVQWTPDGGLPIVFDCYRARGERPRDLLLDAQGQTALILDFQAKPFGRSPSTQSISVDGTLQIDSFDTAPTGGGLSTTTKIEGTGSATFVSGTPVSRSFAAKDLSPYSQVTIQLYSSGTWPPPTFSVTVALTLASAGGSTRYTTTATVANGGWSIIGIPLTGGTVVSGSGVSLAAVTSYSLTVTYSGGTPSNRRIDDMRASGSASAPTSTTHGSQILLPGVVGSARTPTNIALTNGSTFSSFLLHTPPGTQDSNAAILSSLSTASTNQTITIAANNAKYAGTYSVVLGVGTSGGGSVTATVTVTQLENGVAVGSTQVLTKTYTSGALLVPVGEVTLPLYAVPTDNTLTTFTFQVQITGADRYSELMLLDTAGQTIFTDSNLSTARAAVYVDEPSALQSGPSVYASASDRTGAFGIPGNCVMSGGPILLDPGTNKMIAWVGTSTPTLTATYYPRWLDERTV